MSEYTFHPPCSKCGSCHGEMTPTRGQNVVRCECGAFQYNASKVETGEKPRSVATVHNGIKPKQRARILARDGGACVLCHARDVPLHVGHMLSVEAGLAIGLTEEELNDDSNLGALCEQCNLGLGKQPMPIKIYAGILRTICKGLHQ